MRLEDLKQDMPKTPDFIHSMIEAEVKKQLEDTKVIAMKPKKVKRWTGTKVAAVLAASVLSVSAAAYAGNVLYHMYMEKTGNYSIHVGIKNDESSDVFTLPETVHDIDIQANYIPQGMVWEDEKHLGYPQSLQRGGFSFASVLLDEDDLGKALQDKNVIDSETGTFSGYEGVYVRYHQVSDEIAMNQRIYLLCPDLNRVMVIYVGSDVCKEDAIKVAQNLVITENDTVVDTADMFTWSEEISAHGHSNESAAITEDKASADELPVHAIGETWSIPAYDENTLSGKRDDCMVSVSVDSVDIADDFSLLNSAYIQEDWKNALGADGKIEDATLTYVKSGDGVTTVDEVVRMETVKQKLVYAKVTYTNNTDEEMQHLLYGGTLMYLTEEDGKYQIVDQNRPGADYDYIKSSSIYSIPEMGYYSVVDDYGNGGNSIVSLKPGESIQVDMAWIVREDTLNSLYLNLLESGRWDEFTPEILNFGVADIRQ